MQALPLGDNAATDSLVNNYTQGVRSDIEYSSCPAVVGLVWHTLLNCTITLKANS